jgi:MOSC domain-containing protein YiiM
MGLVAGIWIKRGSGAPMDAATSAQLVAGRGIVGNANQGGKRQVTLMSAEQWSDMTAHLGTPDPGVRRANILVSGVDLGQSRGKTLRVGSVRIRIYGETRPCELMDDACPGLRAALAVPWGGGAFGEVLDDGAITIGDPAEWDVEGRVD